MTELTAKIGQHPGHVCKVCGDRASGKHYGSLSCDGCRGFFKRSIRRNLEYICKEGGSCIVDVSRRNQCQACRFAKCLNVANMRREAVQHERAPRSSNLTHTLPNSSTIVTPHPVDIYMQRNRLPASGLPSNFFLSLPMPVHLPAAFPVGDSTRFGTPFYGNLLDSISFGPGILSSSYSIHAGTASNKYEHSDTVRIVNNTNRLNHHEMLPKEDEVTSSEEAQQLQPTNNQMMANHYAMEKEQIQREIVFESAAKLLFLSVKWARSVPSFNQLTLNDQTALLEESWAELFVLTAAQWGMPIDSAATATGVQLLQKSINQFHSLRIDTTETAYLKAIVLFKPDTLGIAATSQIASLQDQTLNLLHDKCGGVRAGHLLLLLPQIRVAANRETLQDIFFKKTIGEIPIERLLGDLIKA